jgi:hypothetical protein
VERLSRMAFGDAAADGLVLHDAVHTALAERLRSLDPDRFRSYRAAAWHHVRAPDPQRRRPRTRPLDGRPPLPDRRSRRARGAVPDHGAPLLRRARPPRGHARHPGAVDCARSA